VIQIQGLAKAFATKIALAPLDLSVKKGEFLAVLGPSGCGKTTLMRLLAGLEKPDLGTIVLDGQDVTALPAFQRDVALVFQMFTLYPHLSVIDNVTFPLRAQGVSASQAIQMARPWLDRMEVGHLALARPQGLSGGDRQKIAMARAMVRQPKLFLFDEPLSALDPGSREAMWGIVRKDLSDRGATCLLVTHDQSEAMALGDRLAVMRASHLEQCDKSQNVYDAPANLFVADFVGTPGMNLLPARRKGDWVTFDGLPMRIRISDGLPGRQTLAVGDMPCVVGIRPEWVAIGEDGVPVTVEHTAYLGAANLLEMRVGKTPVRSWLPAGVHFKRGERVHMQWMPSACRFFETKSGELQPWRALEVACPAGA
jgi:ABC-type sugar transport system ATPase subunit